MINVKQFGAKGNGKQDDTTAIQRCFERALAKPGGDSVYLPAGVYPVKGLSLAQSKGEWQKHVRLYGDSWQASRIFLNTEGIGIDCIGASNLEFENIGIQSGNLAPSVGVLWARSETSNSANNNRMRNVQINGWFTQAAFATFGAELQQVEGCRFENSKPYSVSLAAGTDGKIWKPTEAGGFECVQVESPNGTIPYFGAECNNYRGCIIDANEGGTGCLPLSIADNFHGNFDGCFIAANAEKSPACAMVFAESKRVFHGPLNFRGCTFEAPDHCHGIAIHRGKGVQGYFGIHVDSCQFVLHGDWRNQCSLTYLGDGREVCAFQNGSYRSGFRYDQQTPGVDRVKLHYVQWSDFWMPSGKLEIDNANVGNRIVALGAAA